MPTPDIQLDRAGFPLLWVEPLQAYMHFLPVTKIQIETFLCEAPNPQYGDAWYSDLLERNERISPRSIKSDNFWQAFVTGVLPSEGEAYADWCNEKNPQFVLPTDVQWRDAYQYLTGQSALAPFWKSLEGMTTRARLLADKLTSTLEAQYCSAGRSLTLADQMFMRYGVMEWVVGSGQLLPLNDWGGFGKTDGRFHSTMFDPASGIPEKPHTPLHRINYYGFRLFKRR